MAKRQLEKLVNELQNSKRKRVYASLFLLQDLFDTDYNFSVNKETSHSLVNNTAVVHLDRQNSVLSVLSDVDREHEKEKGKEPAVEAVEGEIEAGSTCLTCKLKFSLLEDQRSHFRSDWHRLNVKLKLKGKETLTEAKANEYFEREDYDDAESLSGSGTDESDLEETVEEPKKLSHASFIEVRLKLKVNAEVRALGATVLNKKSTDYNYDSLDKEKPWIVILHSAGHFAAVVFKQEKVITSKTIHRYVVRKKQGGSQSANDNSKGKAKSAGANLRRHNEQMLQKEVKALITAWSSHIASCSRIFISISRTKRSILYQNPDILNPNDDRIRRIPFPTRRPTLNEATRTLKKLSLVSLELPSVKPDAKVVSKIAVNPPSPPVQSEQPIQQKVIQSEVEETEKVDDRVIEFLKVCTDTNIDKAAEILHEYGQEVLFLSNNEGDTALHVASAKDNEVMINFLLEQGSNPESRDFRGRVPYQLCKKKDSRDWYFMGKHPDLWDYSKAAVPSAITEDMEKARKEKAKAKKKRQALKRRENKQKKLAEEAEAKKLAEAKAALEEASAKKCSSCEKKLIGPSNSWFNRFDYVYCSNACVQSHRRVLSAEAAQRRLAGK